MLRMASLIAAAVAVGLLAAYNAAPPVTCGVAIDVPLYEAYADVRLLPGTVDMIPDPGAPISTVSDP